MSSNSAHRILLVDDNEMERDSVAESLAREGYQIETAPNGRVALEKVESFNPHVIVTDIQMPQMDGVELLTELHQRESSIPVIVMTGYGSVEKAVSVVHDLKAFWFLEKPVQTAVLRGLIERAVAQSDLMRETQRLSRELSMQGLLGNLVGRSKLMQQVFSQIQQVAPSNAGVMITGESGTGKEMVAREIHRLSPRRPVLSSPSIAPRCRKA